MSRIEPSAEAPSTVATPEQMGWVERISTIKRPGLAFAVFLGLLYSPFLFQPFLIDDYRAIAYCEEYENNERESLDLYLLVRGPEQVKQDRLANYLPWWVSDDFHIRYLRPVSELFLYGQYKLFGNGVFGYRLVGLLLYIVCVVLAYHLYRSWIKDDSFARWSALIFSLAACNGVPVIFVSAQCDLLSLATCLASMLLITRFVRGEGAVWLLLGVLSFAVGLGSKEAALPTCVLPLAMLPLIFKKEAAERKVFLKRTVIATAPLLAVALGFVAYYAQHHYGSNGLIMINPLRDPLKYLQLMPLYSLMLLSGWILQTNPIYTYVLTTSYTAIFVFCLLGAICLIYLAIILIKHSPRHPALPVFGFWALAFLPLLSCTSPDSRTLMLPMVGLAAILGVWLTGRKYSDAAESAIPVRTLKKLPTVLFLFGAAGLQLLSCWGMEIIEWKTASNIRQAAAQFERPATSEDTIFFLSSRVQLDILWSQYRADYLLGKDAPRVCFLTHMPTAQAERLDDHTLRVTATGIPYFKSYLAKVARTKGKLSPGVTYDAGEYTATIAEMNAQDEVTAVDFRFQKPLDSDRYLFLETQRFGGPKKLKMSKKIEEN